MTSMLVFSKVHITNKTYELLKKEYSIVPTNKGETVPQFRQNNLQTFLVSPVSIPFEKENKNQFIFVHKSTSLRHPTELIFICLFGINTIAP